MAEGVRSGAERSRARRFLARRSAPLRAPGRCETITEGRNELFFHSGYPLQSLNSPPNYGNPHHRCRPFMDESLLRPRLRDHPLHLETGLACRQQTVAGHREGTRSIQRAPTLGKVIHNFVSGTQEHLQEDARIR